MLYNGCPYKIFQTKRLARRAKLMGQNLVQKAILIPERKAFIFRLQKATVTA
jgi:hypothetical protein